jgi:hypothetical protein
MAKKPSLGAALSASAKPASAPAETPSTSAKTPGRVGKVQVAGFFSPEVAQQIKVMAAAESKTVQLLLAEALNDLFAKYGKPQLADTTDSRKGRGG